MRPYMKRMFQLVLPFLFPGYYGEDHSLAFRTFLALAGVCRGLRYWNFLRRWVAFTSPPRLRDHLRSHSFWTPLKPSEINEEQEILRLELARRDELIDVPFPIFRSCWLKNAFCREQLPANAGNYEMDIGGNPFYDVIECICDSNDSVLMNRTVICFRAASFSELCLFVYSTCFEGTDDFGANDSFLIHCGWKVPDREGFFHYRVEDTASVMQRRLLGWLRRVGSYAPQEVGFHCGSLPTNSFGLFLQLANTQGKRGGKSPFERLEQFVHQWFPLVLFGDNPVHPAYVFPIEFE